MTLRQAQEKINAILEKQPELVDLPFMVYDVEEEKLHGIISIGRTIDREKKIFTGTSATVQIIHDYEE